MTGEKMDNIRISLGWSKRELAKRLGVTETTVHNLIKKEKVPGPVEMIMKVWEKGIV